MKKICLLLLLPLIFAASATAQANPKSGFEDVKNAIISYSDAIKTEIKTIGYKISNLAARQVEPVKAATSELKILEGKTLRGFSTGDAAVDGYIVDSCLRYNIDPLLIYAQMYQESKFKSRALSHKGASGLMQLIPATAVRFGVKDINDPQQNIEGGVKYMRWLLNKFDGNLHLALAAYNAGENSVKKYGNQIPPYRETQNYVAKITAHYDKINFSNLENLQAQR